MLKGEMRSERRDEETFFSAFDSITCIFSPLPPSPSSPLFILHLYHVSLTFHWFISQKSILQLISVLCTVHLSYKYIVRYTFLFFTLNKLVINQLKNLKTAIFIPTSIIVSLQIIFLLLFCNKQQFSS